jgi:hypothetical protein
MAVKPCRRFTARIEPPKRAQARIAETRARQAVLTGLALRFLRDNPLRERSNFFRKISFWYLTFISLG